MQSTKFKQQIHLYHIWFPMYNLHYKLIPTNNILQYYSQVHNITTMLNIAKFRYSVINFTSTLFPLLSIVRIMTEAPSHLNISIKSFTNNYKYNNLCTYAGIIFYEETPSHLNISIKNFTNNYKYNNLRTYAGIIFYEETRNIYNEKRSICVDHGDFYKYRNIYSNKSEMLVAIYAYKGYGTLYISMNISTTECRLSLRNRLCTYGFYCLNSKLRTDFYNTCEKL